MRSQLETLFRENRTWLLERMRRRTNGLDAAEDVVGETFLQMAAHRALHEVRELRALLMTIAKRVMFDLWRKRDLERAYLDELALMGNATDSSPEDRLVVIQALQAIDRALSGLPPKARQAFLCCQLTDMTYAQIARTLGVSASMVRQYVARAMIEVLHAASGPEQPPKK